jgi:hypothetical protein
MQVIFSFGRWSFNLTLSIGSIFGIAMGGSGTFIALASLAAVSSVGVGGNIPVDSAVFLGAFARSPTLSAMPSPVTAYRFHSQFSPVSTHNSFYLVGHWATDWLSGGLDVRLTFPILSLNTMSRSPGRLLQTSPAPRLARARVQITWAGVIWYSR